MGKKIRIMSGMRPTGKLHLGHLIGALENWKSLQNEYECFFSIVDWHALTTSYRETKEISQNIKEIAIDYLSGGVDPNKCLLYIQSHIPEIAELHLLFSMIIPVAWLERVPTYKEQLRQLLIERGISMSEEEWENETKSGPVLLGMPPSIDGGIEELTRDISDRIMREKLAKSREFEYLATYGFLGYPLLQTADIAIVKGELVPVGKDQLPHLEFAREFIRRFHHIYKCQIFPEPKGKLTEMPLVPGIDGRKMSKSYGNSILISDPPQVIAQKAQKTITDPQKIYKNDPGHPEICNIFFYHNISNKKEVPEIADNCRKGVLGCVDCKKNLANKLSDFLAPIRERRAELEAKPHDLNEILTYGARKVRPVAQETIAQVREAMHLSSRLENQ